MATVKIRGKATKSGLVATEIVTKNTVFNMSVPGELFARLQSAANDKGFDNVQALLRVISKEWLTRRGY